MDRNFAGNVGTGGSPVVNGVLRSDGVDPLLTDREVASYFGIGRSTVWRWVSDGILPEPIRLGGLSRWRQSDTQSVIDRASEAREVA